MSITIRKLLAVFLVVAMVLPLAYFGSVQAQNPGNVDSCQPIVPETPVRGEGQHQVMLIFTVNQDGMATHDKFESNYTESSNPYRNAGASRFIYYVNDGEKPLVPEYSPAVPFRAWLKQKSMKHFSHWAVAQEVDNGSGIQVVPGERFDFNQRMTGDVRLVAVYEDVLLSQDPLFQNYGFTVTAQMPNGDFHVSNAAKVTAVEYSAERVGGEVVIKRYRGDDTHKTAVAIPAEEVPEDVVGLQPNERVTHYEVEIPTKEVLDHLKNLDIPKEYVIYGNAVAQVYGNSWLPRHDDTYVSQKMAITEGFLTAEDKLFDADTIKYVVKTEKFRRCYGNVYGGNIVVPFARKAQPLPKVDECQPIDLEPIGPKPEGYHAVTILFTAIRMFLWLRTTSITTTFLPQTTNISTTSKIANWQKHLTAFPLSRTEAT